VRETTIGRLAGREWGDIVEKRRRRGEEEDEMVRE
jgi:hypothetical protein